MTAGERREKMILAPGNGTAYDERALDIALLLASREYAGVSAIYVVVVPQELPLEAEMPEAVTRGEEVLRAAEEHARAHGREIEVELLQARAAGPAIVDEAVARGANMIVMATSLLPRSG